jgi:hypothetical protein
MSGRLLVAVRQSCCAWRSQRSPIQGVTDFNSVSAVSKNTAYLGGAHRASTDDDPVTTFAMLTGHKWKAESSTL